MPQRIRTRNAAFNDRPFQGRGASLYVTEGATVRYRNLRILGRRRRRSRSHTIKGSGGIHDLAATSVQKTARVDSVTYPTAQFDWSIPASLASATVTIDVRTYEDDVENLTDNYRAVTRKLDANRDDDTGILGLLVVLEQSQRDGGVVRLRLRYEPSLEGVQPTEFVAIATAGPTSPADATVSYDGERYFEIDTPALSDTSDYTYTIRATNGSTTADLVTGLTVSADASGPPQPTNVSGIPY